MGEASDYEKLMDLALWFDMHAEERGIHGQDEVQKDLRRIAQRLLKIDGGKSFTRGQAG